MRFEYQSTVSMLSPIACATSLLARPATRRARLAGELAHAADPRAAFANYERRMRSFVAVNQKIARDVFAMIPKTPWRAWLTDMVIRAIAHLPGKAFIGRKMAEDTHRAARAISLPDYAMPQSPRVGSTKARRSELDHCA